MKKHVDVINGKTEIESGGMQGRHKKKEERETVLELTAEKKQAVSTETAGMLTRARTHWS